MTIQNQLTIKTQNNNYQIKKKMKKFLFAAIAVLFALSLSAQDIKKIRSAYDKKDWAKAKEAVDLALATEKEQKNWLDQMKN